MAQGLRAFTALPENVSLVSRTHVVQPPPIMTIPGEAKPFWLRWASLHMPYTHTDTQIKRKLNI